jgi:hypothetical protein
MAAKCTIYALDSVIPAPVDHPIGTCANPAVIDGFDIWHGTTESGFATQVSTCGEEAESKEQIFSWTTQVDGLVCMTTIGSAYDTVLHVRREICAARRAEVACNDDREGGGTSASYIELEVEAGEPHFIIVDGFSDDSEGGYVLQIFEGACP